ncbi:MAG: hypothetical protein K8J31_09175 [Anaerolineae bacterium]|nr:hypothetical protein [Anaerolineae bacterium]
MSINVAKPIVMFLMIWTSFSPVKVNAQAVQSTPLNCGDIIESELLGDQYYQDYVLRVQAGTKLDLTVTPIGSGFNPFIFVLDAGGSEIVRSNKAAASESEEFLEYPISSSNATLRVLGAAPTLIDELTWARAIDFTNGDGRVVPAVGSYFGAYSISFGCTLRDGTVIEPGDYPVENISSSGGLTLAAAPVFSGTGFPGLGPVDFANAFKLPLSLGASMPGSIPPTGDAILGLTFDASAGDTFALDFARTAGNLNLGVVILSANNEVVFQASLVTSESLSTRLTLPSTGQYTIGVFRIDLLPPAAPEATQFQVTGTLNP